MSCRSQASALLERRVAKIRCQASTPGPKGSLMLLQILFTLDHILLPDLFTPSNSTPKSIGPIDAHQIYPSIVYRNLPKIFVRPIRGTWAQKMSGPYFFQQPLRYLRWASHEKPAIFYSFVIGSGGPLSFFVAPPIRRFFNDGPREKIPLTYPSMLSLRSALHYSWTCCGQSLFVGSAD